MKIKPKKKGGMKITYHYVKPKNEEEAKEQEKKVAAVYDLIFEEALKTWKKG